MPRPGVRGEEIWLACPHCGDSGKEHSVHYSVNRNSRVYHCFRCGESGKLTTSAFVELTGSLPGLQLTSSTTSDIEDFPIVMGAGSSRSSALDRYHITSPTGDVWDVFLSRRPTGEVLGAHLRGAKKRSLSYGQRALGYAGDELVADWIRLVEGPYDVIEPNDVCTFGMPSVWQLRMLRGYPVMLCPDGDAWTKPHVMKAYLAAFNRVPLEILGIERIPEGADPDEVKSKFRERHDRRVVDRLMRATRMEMTDRIVFHHMYLLDLR